LQTTAQKKRCSGLAESELVHIRRRESWQSRLMTRTSVVSCLIILASTIKHVIQYSRGTANIQRFLLPRRLQPFFPALYSSARALSAHGACLRRLLRNGLRPFHREWIVSRSPSSNESMMSSRLSQKEPFTSCSLDGLHCQRTTICRILHSWGALGLEIFKCRMMLGSSGSPVMSSKEPITLCTESTQYLVITRKLAGA